VNTDDERKIVLALNVVAAAREVLDRHQPHPSFSGESPVTGCTCGHAFERCPTRKLLAPVIAAMDSSS
jgi:hypothetical protein